MPKKQKNKNLLLITLIIGLMVGAPTPAYATTTTWTGGAGTYDWFTALNWDTEAVPTSSDGVHVDNVSDEIDITGSTIEVTSLYLGYEEDSNTTFTVSGNSTSFSTSSILRVGYYGTGTLIISEGATYTGYSLGTGMEVGASGDIVVTGSGTHFTLTGWSTIGDEGSGTLLISNGASVSMAGGVVANEAASTAQLTITGTGTSVTSSSGFYIGDGGTGFLVVSDGASFSTTILSIANASGSGTAIVSGEDTEVTATGNFFVGYTGTGVFELTDGASLTALDSYVGRNEGSVGTIVVSGSGTVWNTTNRLMVGSSGEGTLRVTNGGKVIVGETLRLGNSAGGNGTIIVSGTDSQILVTQYISVGLGWDDAATGTLIIENGGYVSNTYARIGDNNSSIGTVIVTGSGSRWVNSNYISVGRFGTGYLTISDGASVSNTIARIAEKENSTGTVVVTGSGSTWTSQGILYVGDYGAGFLSVLDGGFVSATGAFYVGVHADAEGTFIISGKDSTLSSSSEIRIGGSGTGTATVSNGASATSTSSTHIGSDTGSEGTLNISGEGTSWTSSSGFYVGYTGAGTVTVSDSATVTSESSTVIGFNVGGTGQVLVTGEGSSWISLNEFRIGSSGIGTLTLSNGGTASSTSIMTIAYGSGSTGTLNIGAASGETAVAPGTISASSLVFGSGTGTLVFNHTSSSYTFDLAMSSGAGTASILVESGFTSLTADSSGFTGTTTVSGGTLSVNGSLGGTITVTSGGRLQGTGTMSTVVIESGGTFAPGNSVGTTTVASLTLESGSSLEIEIDGTGSDVINVTGTLTNNGGDVVITMDEDVSLSTSSSYNYLTYASLSGSSVSVTVEDSLPFLSTTASSTGTTTSVAFSRNGTSFASLAATDNQSKIAGVLDGLSSGDLYQGLISVKNADLARSAYDQLSGALHANVKLSLLSDNKDEIFASRLEEAPSPYVQALGKWTRRDGHSQTSGFSGNSRGILIGEERQIDKDKIFGFAVHYQKANYEEEANLYADATVKSYGASLYGQMPIKQYKTQLKAGLSYSYHDIESHREISISGYSDNPTGDYEAHKLETFIEAAKPYSWGTKGNIEPYGRLNLSYITIPGFKESGGEAALDMQQSKDAIGKTAIGLRFKGELPFEKNKNNKAIFKAHLGWEHIVGDLTTSSTGHLPTLSDASISAAPLARDSVALGAQMQLHYGQSLNLGLRYAGTLAASSASHALVGSISAKF